MKIMLSKHADNKVIRLKLRELLNERGISQKELAKMSGIRESTISEMCRNARSGVNFTHLSKVAEALNISDITELIDFV